MSAIESPRHHIAETEGPLEQEGEEEQTSYGIEVPQDTTVRALQTLLVEFGWRLEVDGRHGPQTFEAVRQFQRGFAWWQLLVDGYAGPKTWEAIEYVRTSSGRCSPNFWFKEFKCRCSGSTKACIGIKLSRYLILGLEEYRDLVGHAVVVRSGYRDPRWNRLRGGTPNSQHLYGNALDLHTPEVSLTRVKRLKQFSGIGYVAATGLALHLDVRHCGPRTTMGTPSDPTTWWY